MMRASEEQLRGRTILKAARSSGGAIKATKKVLSTRKIYKAKRFTGGSEPTSSSATPAPHLHAKAPNSKSGQMHSSRPSPTATIPTNDSKSAAATPTPNSSPPMPGAAPKAAGPTNVEQTFDFTPANMRPQPRATKEVIGTRKIYKVHGTTSSVTPTQNHHTNDPNSKTEQMPSSEPAPAPTATKPTINEEIESAEKVFRVRAKLFSKAGKSWERRAAGTLTCYRNANNQVLLKLLNEKDSMVALDLCVAILQNVKRVIKESDKGKATHVRFDCDKGDGPFLLQVKPENLEQLFSVMALK